MKALRRNAARSDTGVEGRIALVLVDVASLLRIEHSALELAEFDPASGQLTVAMHGSCPDCPGSPAMFVTAIEAHVRQRIPEVREVRIHHPLKP